MSDSREGPRPRAIRSMTASLYLFRRFSFAAAFCQCLIYFAAAGLLIQNGKLHTNVDATPLIAYVVMSGFQFLATGIAAWRFPQRPKLWFWMLLFFQGLQICLLWGLGAPRVLIYTLSAVAALLALVGIPALRSAHLLLRNAGSAELQDAALSFLEKQRSEEGLEARCSRRQLRWDATFPAIATLCFVLGNGLFLGGQLNSAENRLRKTEAIFAQAWNQSDLSRIHALTDHRVRRRLELWLARKQEESHWGVAVPRLVSGHCIEEDSKRATFAYELADKNRLLVVFDQSSGHWRLFRMSLRQ